MAIPFLVSREESLVGVMLLERGASEAGDTDAGLEQQVGQHVQLIQAQSRVALQQLQKTKIRRTQSRRQLELPRHAGAGGQGAREGTVDSHTHTHTFDKNDRALGLKLAGSVASILQSKLSIQHAAAAVQLKERLQEATQAIFTSLVAVQQALAEVPEVKRRRGAGAETAGPAGPAASRAQAARAGGAATAQVAPAVHPGACAAGRSLPSVHAAIIHAAKRMLEADECFLLVRGGGGGGAGEVRGVRDALIAARWSRYSGDGSFVEGLPTGLAKQALVQGLINTEYLGHVVLSGIIPSPGQSPLASPDLAAPAVPAPSCADCSPTLVSELEALASLMERGVLTGEEFGRAKDALLLRHCGTAPAQCGRSKAPPAACASVPGAAAGVSDLTYDTRGCGVVEGAVAVDDAEHDALDHRARPGVCESAQARADRSNVMAVPLSVAGADAPVIGILLVSKHPAHEEWGAREQAAVLQLARAAASAVSLLSSICPSEGKHV